MSNLELDCIEIIRKKLSKEMTGEEFYLALIDLDKKYPGIGFYKNAQKFANKWLKQVKKERLPYRDD